MSDTTGPRRAYGPDADELATTVRADAEPVADPPTRRVSVLDE